MNDNNTLLGGTLHNNVSGQYKVLLVDKNKNIVSESPWNKNLILNQGMDALYHKSYGEIAEYAIAGTGSRPNFISGGDSTITQSGNLIELWPGATGLQCFSCSLTASVPYEVYYSSSLQTGDWIVYGNGSQSVVVAIDSVGGRSASLSQSYNIPSGSNETFTIWKTAQVGLQKEIKRAGNGIPSGASYLTGTGNCGHTDSTGSNGNVNVRTYRRTHDFVPETITRDYTEIGTGWQSSGNLNVFSRMLLPAPVTVAPTYNLRVIYDLRVEVADTFRLITASISGWPVAPSTNTHASESVQVLLLTTLSTAGGPDTAFAQLDPSSTFSTFTGLMGWLSASSSSLRPFGTAIDRFSGAVLAEDGVGKDVYVTGSYTAYKYTIWGLNAANMTNISSVGFGNRSNVNGRYPYAASWQAVTTVFHQTQSKANTQTLTMYWKWTWARTLTN